jgi:hypothetical protein
VLPTAKMLPKHGTATAHAGPLGHTSLQVTQMPAGAVLREHPSPSAAQQQSCVYTVPFMQQRLLHAASTARLRPPWAHTHLRSAPSAVAHQGTPSA